MISLTLTPAAERKRQQRARAASGQVHRVAVYLTDEEAKMIERLSAASGDCVERTLVDCLRHVYADFSWANRNPSTNPAL